MSDEMNNGSEGFLGKAKRLADRLGEYARSDEAKEKLDAVKKRAIQAGEVAAAGAKKVAEGTKQPAVQAREKADEFSKSERGQALKAKAKEDWDEIRGGSFRGLKLTESPIVVGMAIFLFFPLGLFLLWKHPVLGRSKAWWGIGGFWSLAVFASVVNGDKDRRPDVNEPAVADSQRTQTRKDLRSQGDGPTSTARSASVAKKSQDAPSVHPLFFDENGRKAIYRELREGTSRIEAEANERFGVSKKEDNLRGVLVGDKRLTEKSRWQMQRLTELYEKIEEQHKLPDGGLGSINKEAESKGW